MTARINVMAGDPAASSRLADDLDLPRFIADTLVARGIDTVEEAKRFLTPSLERDWGNPYRMKGMDEAVDRIARAIIDREKIVVFGDFDLDGVSATALMTRGLRACSGIVEPFIPLRFEEGYGLSQAAIDRMSALEPDLVVTVDNGIAAKVEVACLKERGIDVVITDHHELADLVPEGVALVDPKESDNPDAILAGAGVALKVVQAVGSRFGMPELWLDLVDLATLGTVADLMPMRDQNRALVSEGIRMINEAPRVCIAALLGESGFADKPVTSSNLSFTLVPRLNAAGRMGNAQLALDLLMCDEFAEAARLAAELEDTNTRRRAIEAELAEVASVEAERVFHGQRALVVAGEGWHEGVKGIVASRLTNVYGVPSLLFTIDGDIAHGSGRSVGEVNLFEAVSSCSDILVRFGGHHAAVGVTIETDKLPLFAQRLCDYMDELPADEFVPRVDVDAVVDLAELTISGVERLERLAPFGQENPNPRFLAHGVMMASGRAVGADKSHLSCLLTDGSASLASIMFRCPDIDGLVSCGCALDAVFELQIDSWRGRRSVKAVLKSLKPLAPCRALEQCLSALDDDFMTCLVSPDAEESVDEPDAWQPSDDDRRVWANCARETPRDFERAAVRALAGVEELRPSQAEALSLLGEGKSLFVVMGTGRGKSLIFQLHALRLALTRNEMSVFVYPLRALVADQAFHLERALAPFGVAVETLSGATDQAERARIQSAIAQGRVDIVLTTPEYLQVHADAFACGSRVGFVVIDEAHHIGTSTESFRPVYRRLAHTCSRLGEDVQVLALTATADAATDRIMREEFAIDACLIDESARDNLFIDDHRNAKKREQFLVSLVAQAEKTIIYVNSRMESIALTRELRSREPHIASLIGFYNAGLSRDERSRVEKLFREGGLQVLVATSAFGEGIDIPGVRHVVLYHMPFSEVEFNQMSGRAGRDGEVSSVHVLYGKEDARINDALLSDEAPDHDVMAQIYRALRAMQRESGEPSFPFDAATIASRATRILSREVRLPQVESAVAVFYELGLVEVGGQPCGCADQARIHVVDYEGKVELEDSVRYREGRSAQVSFEEFKAWALSSSASSMEERIRRPLTPGDGQGKGE